MRSNPLTTAVAILLLAVGALRAEEGACGGGDAGGACGGGDIGGGGGGSCGTGAECSAGFDAGASNPFGLSNEEVGAIAGAYGRATQTGALNAGLSDASAAALGAMAAAAVANGLNSGLPAGFVSGADLAALGAAVRGFAAAEGVDAEAVGRAVKSTVEATDSNS